MPSSILEVKERLERVIDQNGSVRDMATASEAISILEKTTVTKKDLEMTRLGLHVNNIRKAARNSPLAKRAKNLVKSWRQMIEKETQHCPPMQIRQSARPETPNSVGSSPSPPEPPDHNSIRNYPPINTPSYSTPRPRSDTSALDSGGKKSKKHKVTSDAKSNKRKDVPDGAITHKSSEVKVQNEKESLDAGQHLISVGSNGLKLTFKTHPSAQTAGNQNRDVTDGNRPATLQRSLTDSTLALPHKSHKKKKGHKSPHKSSSPALTSNATERLSKQEDVYNNNNTEAKIKTSKSSPNFTVKNKSPDKIQRNNAIVTTPKSYDRKSLSPETATFNLKRKRDQSTVDSALPEHTTDRPRAPKERRLTYDPMTGQLKQVPSQDKLDEKSPKASEPMPKKTPEKSLSKEPKVSLKNGKDAFLRNGTEPSPKTITPREKTPLKLSQKVVTPVKNLKTEVEAALEDFQDADGLLTRLLPNVRICDDVAGTPLRSCTGTCSATNFYEARREFRKRKTRRKDDPMQLTSLYPISNLVENYDTESDEDSLTKNDFSSSISVENPESSSHSQNCKWSGVTGCCGNNGSWYDWTETFCIHNHQTSEPLPDEEKIMPLQILPYVELD